MNQEGIPETRGYSSPASISKVTAIDAAEAAKKSPASILKAAIAAAEAAKQTRALGHPNCR